MKISKSKHQLAQLLIEAGVTQFPEGTNLAAQDKGDHCIWGYVEKSFARSGDWHKKTEGAMPLANPTRLVSNWHQTVLSREEFDQIVAETTVTSEPELVELTSEDLNRMRGTTVESPEQRAKLARIYAPTLDQLLQDWRNADDYAQRKQTEADEAAAMRDERWKAVQARAGEMGVTVGRCEPVVTEQEREWSILDHCIVVDSPDDTGWEGRKCALLDVDYNDDRLPYSVIDATGSSLWVHGIRRP